MFFGEYLNENRRQRYGTSVQNRILDIWTNKGGPVLDNHSDAHNERHLKSVICARDQSLVLGA